MKKLVFISHITEEKELAILLKDIIEEAFLGLIEVFISSDEDSIVLGNKWLDKITDGLRKCHIEFILCSPISVTRPWINFEAGCGWIREIPVIPLCHSGMEPSNLPLPLNLLQGAKATDIDDLNKILHALAYAIESKIPIYDFTSFLDKANNFINKYTYWDKINKAFSLLSKIDRNISNKLKALDKITLKLSEMDISLIEIHIPFLREKNILNAQRDGGAGFYPSSGWLYDYTLIPLPVLVEVINNPLFKCS